MRLSPFMVMLVLMLMSHSVRADDPSGGPLKAVDSVDLARYCGVWYEIARLPNSFQSDCAGEVTAEYTLLEDGDLRIVNRCRKANGERKESEGKGRLAERNGPASRLKVRFAPAFLSFLPFVWGDYWIIDLATDYSFAVVGEPGRKYLWVLARKPTMEEGTLQGILDRAKAQGYDVSGILRTPHSE